MKTTITKLAVAAVGVFAISSTPARAILIIDLNQSGPDVVATGSGTINKAALTLTGSSITFSGSVAPANRDLVLGATGAKADTFSGLIGPSNFGLGSLQVFANSGGGDIAGIFFGSLVLPTGYVSGSQLSDISVWSNETLSNLGITPGTYTWHWGSGANADSLTVLAAVPEPCTAFFGIALCGLTVMRRRRNA